MRESMTTLYLHKDRENLRKKRDLIATTAAISQLRGEVPADVNEMQFQCAGNWME